MAEYLAPGVYIEETSFRSKSIEGVSTSTAGFVGPTRYGPVSGEPQLVTSFPEFERVYGGLVQLRFNGVPTHNYVAHGVRAFFENGGRRLYISRIDDGTALRATATIAIGDDQVALQARHPGEDGNVRVTFTIRFGPLAYPGPPIDPNDPPQIRGVLPNDIVLIREGGVEAFYRAERTVDGVSGQVNWSFRAEDGVTVRDLGLLAGSLDFWICAVSVNVEVAHLNDKGELERSLSWEGLSFDPESPRSITQIFNETLQSASRHASVPIIVRALNVAAALPANLNGQAMVRVLIGTPAPALVPVDPSPLVRVVPLTGGTDGNRPLPGHYAGAEINGVRSGLLAFEDIADISIMAAPGHSASGGTPNDVQAIANAVISHCERMRYRIAVLDAREGSGLTDVRDYRGRFDSSHAAFYYPWVIINDPVTRRQIALPPSGAVAGIYARNDTEKGVHKAPANEIVRQAIGFESLINQRQQEVLNPEHINVLRFFEGRGYRLWGARTMSSDPEFKYVNVRRYLAYLERSIERGTQWAVFENNGPKLWANVRSTVDSFLFNEFLSDRLFGLNPEEAFFVRCDLSTMSQNDLDNGRLICLVGVSLLRPAEFVIFRIGQFTAEGRR